MKPIILYSFFFALVLISCEENKKAKTSNVYSLPEDTVITLASKFKEVNDKLRNDVDNSGLYLRRARLQQEKGDLIAAVKDLNRAIKIDSVFPEFYLLKAELLKQQNNLLASKETLEKCMKIDNANVQARVALGWLALIGLQHKQALDYADAALKRDIYCAEAYYLKGMIFYEKKDTTVAISSLLTAVEQENDYYEAYILLGMLHYSQKNDLAKGFFENALRIRPNSLEALYNFGIYCQDHQNYDEAISTYHKIIKLKKYKEPYFNLGYIHHEYLQDYKQAIIHYTDAINVEKKYFEAYYNRGLCHEFLNDVKNAEMDFRKALEINPSYTFAAKALSRIVD